MRTVNRRPTYQLWSGDPNQHRNTRPVPSTIESYFLVEGRLQNYDGTAYADVDLIHNGIMYLFKTIWYRLSGQQIEHINDPDIATTMLGMLTFLDDFFKTQGLNRLWYKDSSTDAETENTGFTAWREYIITKPTNKGSYSFAIPLKHIMGLLL